MTTQENLGVFEAASRFIVRFKTAGSKNKNIVLHAARHNLREIRAALEGKDHGPTDPSRTHLNRRIHGPATAAETAALAKAMMKTAGCKVRANAALVLEIVFSLSSGTKIDESAYFFDCLLWSADVFGGIRNVLGADVHRDQTHPHLHVLIAPIKGNRLAATEMMSGGIKRLNELNSDFFERVASRYGLRQGVKEKPVRSKRNVAAEVIKKMLELHDPATTSQSWLAIRAAIESSPALAERLRIDMERRPKNCRSVNDPCISGGKGSSKEETHRCSATETVEHLSCVGVRDEQHVPVDLRPTNMSRPLAPATVDLHMQAAETDSDAATASAPFTSKACGTPAATDRRRAGNPHAQASQCGRSGWTTVPMLQRANEQPLPFMPNASTRADFESLNDDTSCGGSGNGTIDRDPDLAINTAAQRQEGSSTRQLALPAPITLPRSSAPSACEPAKPHAHSTERSR